MAAIYPIVYLDAVHFKLRRDGKVSNPAVHMVMGVDLEGHPDILGHRVPEGAEGANFWLSVITDLQSRGVEDMLIACADGWADDLSKAVHAVFKQTEIQRCIVRQIRNSLRYVSGKDRKAFVQDFKAT